MAIRGIHSPARFSPIRLQGDSNASLRANRTLLAQYRRADRYRRKRNVHVHRSGATESLTFRPEGTASVIRAYIQNNLGEAQPLVKVYYIGPMFRQERPQAGRLRQFHQFGAEAIGSPRPESDAEIIGMAIQIYKELSITGHELKINSVGCEKCRPQYRRDPPDGTPKNIIVHSPPTANGAFSRTRCACSTQKMKTTKG